METQQLETGWRVFMRPDEWQIVVESAGKRKHRIAIYLMSLSLRRTPLTEITAADFFEKDGMHWVDVEGKQAGERYHETRSRSAWVPQQVREHIDAYIQDEGIDDDETIIQVTPRQINNWIDDVAENAKIRTGDEDYLKLSPHDFRRYFATHFLLRLGVDAQTVRQLGGWMKVEHMWEYLLLPTDLIRRRLEEAGITATVPMTLPGDKSAETVKENIDTIRSIIERTDGDAAKEALFAELIALSDEYDRLEVAVKEAAADDEADDDTSLDSSAQDSFDSYGVVPPAWPLVTSAELGAVTKSRLEREHEVISGTGNQWPTPLRDYADARAAAEYAGVVGLTGLLFASYSLSLDPASLSISAPPLSGAALGIGSVIGTTGVLWSDYRDRVEDVSLSTWLRRHLSI